MKKNKSRENSPPLNHHAHNLVKSISGCHGGMLCVRVVCGLRQVSCLVMKGSGRARITKTGRRREEEKLTATSTISAAMRLIPSRPLRMVRSSRVDQPPVSGVPVAGATDGDDEFSVG